MILVLMLAIFVVTTAGVLAASQINLVVNGKAVTDVEAKVIDGSTYVPLRAISEMLGAEVGYDSATKTAYVNLGQSASVELVIDDLIESNIDGTFEGWDGETLFILQNGQIWKQESYAYWYHYAYSPEVLIYKTDDGKYKMKVDGVDKEIYVKKIK